MSVALLFACPAVKIVLSEAQLLPETAGERTFGVELGWDAECRLRGLEHRGVELGVEAGGGALGGPRRAACSDEVGAPPHAGRLSRLQPRPLDPQSAGAGRSGDPVAAVTAQGVGRPRIGGSAASSVSIAQQHQLLQGLDASHRGMGSWS